MKKVIQGGTIINEGQQFQADLVIEGGKITQILAQAPETLLQEAQVIDASHCFVIPGVIDDQVHFREPGLTHKGNIGEGSRAAAAGGVTSFMDMPNVVPPTTTLQLLEEKQEIAGRTSLVNYSFYLGATTDNIGEIKRVNPRTTCGIKAFMGSSTGNMLIDSIPALERLFAESPLLIATHCEDTPTINHNLALYKAKYGDDIPPQYHPLIRSREACLKSSALAASLARKYNQGVIDVIATDHAPHTLSEKNGPYTKAASGGPMVQHSLTVMLELAERGMISMEKIVEGMCHAPAELFRIENRGFIREGYQADLCIFRKAPWTVTKENILYHWGWPPLQNKTLTNKEQTTLVNGHVVYDKGDFYTDRTGERLTFKR